MHATMLIKQMDNAERGTEIAEAVRGVSGVAAVEVDLHQRALRVVTLPGAEVSERELLDAAETRGVTVDRIETTEAH